MLPYYYYGYSRGGAGGSMAIVGLILAIIATVVICILVMPKKKRSSLTGFAATLHDIVNFKSLVIEKILRCLYVFTSCAVILICFFEIATSYAGALLGINTFDQPGVEEGKNATYALLGKKGYDEKRAELARMPEKNDAYIL